MSNGGVALQELGAQRRSGVPDARRGAAARDALRRAQFAAPEPPHARLHARETHAAAADGAPE